MAPCLSYTTPVKVENGKITNNTFDDEPVNFNPVGDKCVIDIVIEGPEEIISEVGFYTDHPGSEPLFSFDASSITMTTEELEVNGKHLYLLSSVRLNDAVSVKDGEYQVRYKYTLHGIDSPFSFNGLSLLTTVMIIVFVIYLLIALNRTVNSNKEYDERQMRMRGIAGLNAMVTAASILMGFGMFDIITDNSPFTVYQVAMITAMVSVTVFAIVADINDAYVGINKKRTVYVILTGIIALTNLLSWLVNGLLSKAESIFSNLAVVSLCIAICSIALCIEMMIKGIVDRKIARKEAEDEKSEA